MSDRPIRLVLDTTAVLAFTRGSIHVGETLAEIVDNQSAAALPVACLAEAHPDAVEPERLAALVAHEATTVIASEAEQWQALGHMYAMLGAFSAASAALIAVDLDCWVLTAQPDLYADVAGGNLSIAVED